MKYQVTQKMLAVGGDYTVSDEFGRQHFYFDGKLFNFGGKKVIVLDTQKKEVARIVKKPFSFKPVFRVKRHGQVVATISKRGFSDRDKFIIDVPGANDYEIIGDYIGKEYTIKRGSMDVARVSKKFFGSTDSYEVEITSGDIVLLLSSVVVIDMVLFTKLKS